jgi:hypothetical protein
MGRKPQRPDELAAGLQRLVKQKRRKPALREKRLLLLLLRKAVRKRLDDLACKKARREVFGQRRTKRKTEKVVQELQAKEEA